MQFYLPADFQSSKVIRFSFISLLMVLGVLCACSSLKFASQKTQSLDRELSSSIEDRNTIPHLHPDIIFQIKDLLAESGYDILKYSSGGAAGGAVGGYAFMKILQKLIVVKVKPAKVITQAASGMSSSPKYPVVVSTTLGTALGGAIGVEHGLEAVEERIDKSSIALRDQDGNLVSDIFLGEGGTGRLNLLLERPVDRVCAVYYYVNQDNHQELDMQYQEEFKKYAYVQDPQYQEWMDKCPERQQTIGWCDNFREKIADEHPVVSRVCERLIKLSRMNGTF